MRAKHLPPETRPLCAQACSAARTSLRELTRSSASIPAISQPPVIVAIDRRSRPPQRRRRRRRRGAANEQEPCRTIQRRRVRDCTDAAGAELEGACDRSARNLLTGAFLKGFVFHPLPTPTQSRPSGADPIRPFVALHSAVKSGPRLKLKPPLRRRAHGRSRARGRFCPLPNRRQSY